MSKTKKILHEPVNPGDSAMHNWIRNALEISHKSQADLSRHLTVALHRTIDKTAVNKMLSGARRIQADELMEIARFTGQPLPGKAKLISFNDSRVTMLEMIGLAETGSFRQADQLGGEASVTATGATSDVPFDPRYPEARQFVLQQRGDGMAASEPPHQRRLLFGLRQFPRRPGPPAWRRNRRCRTPARGCGGACRKICPTSEEGWR
jgi:hypothetical protein